MVLSFKRIGTNLIIGLMGELDHHSAEEVRNKIDDAIERDKINKVILDFSGVTFMDSSGIGVVIGRFKRLSMKNGNLAVVNVNKNINKVFELSGLYKIVKSYDTVEDALGSI